MTRVQSFDPVIGQHPRVIILGSMPGVASLEAVQYYAHPRNQFWPIMGELFGIDSQADYACRINQISALPLILWDTMRSCERPGSLDSNICNSTVEANDFSSLLARFVNIRAIAFNGASSEKYFKKLVLPRLPKTTQIDLLRMPSTSPANAGISYQQKLEKWRQVLDFVD